MQTYAGHEGGGCMGKLLKHVSDDLLQHMKPNEFVVAKPVNQTAKHLLEKHFAPLREKCRFCDRPMDKDGRDTCVRMNNLVSSECYGKESFGILQARPQSVERQQSNGKQQKQTLHH